MPVMDRAAPSGASHRTSAGTNGAVGAASGQRRNEMLALWMIVVCAVGRVVPHPPNVAPVGAVAVLAGRTLSARAAVGITLLAMAVSDLVLAAIHGWPLVGIATPFVYAGFAAQALCGRALRRRRGGAIAAAVAGATLFFVLSNLGVWVAGGYGSGGAGLIACFAAAIPFFGATLAGDVLWTCALTLAFRAIARRTPAAWSTAEARALPAV
jgi:Family of unknown function (DUF6580)